MWDKSGSDGRLGDLDQIWGDVSIWTASIIGKSWSQLQGTTISDTRPEKIRDSMQMSLQREGRIRENEEDAGGGKREGQKGEEDIIR